MGAQQSINAMPQVLILHTADSFLSVSEIVTVATTSQYAHQSLRPYKVKSAQPAWSLLSATAWRIGRVQRVSTTIHDFDSLRRLSDLPASVRTLSFEPSIFMNADVAHLDAWMKISRPPSSITFPPSITEICDFALPPQVEFNSCILPPRLRILTFDENHSRVYITKDTVLPDTLTQLNGIWGDSRRDLALWRLPSTLLDLSFHSKFVLPIEAFIMPDSITRLQFGSSFYRPLVGVHLPASLTELSFGNATLISAFRETLVGVKFPSRLARLHLGWNYDESLVDLDLPDSLTEIKFGQYTRSFSGVKFPTSLQVLDLSLSSYKKSLDDAVHLPASLTDLRLPSGYHADLSHCRLPQNLTQLSCGANRGGSLPRSLADAQLPDSMTSLVLNDSFRQGLEDALVALPASLTHLGFDDDFSADVDRLKLPPSLKQLDFGYSFNSPSIQQLELPESLTRLRFKGTFNIPLDSVKLPQSLTELSFDYSNGPSRYPKQSLFDNSLVNVKLPSALTSLTMSSTYNQSFIGVAFPESLTLLNLGSAYNQPLVGVLLPLRLRELIFGGGFNQSLIDVDLPLSITELRLQGAYNQSFEGVRFPTSLTRLTLDPHHYTHPLMAWHLPPSCRQLSLKVRTPLNLIAIPDHVELLSLQLSDEPPKQNLSSKKRKEQEDEMDALNLSSGKPINLTGLHLPSALRELHFLSYLTLSLKGAVWSSFPQHPVTITFQSFNRPILADHLPATCTNLILGDEWNLPVDLLLLPPQLKRLSFSRAFKRSIDSLRLPSTLEHISFGRCFSGSLSWVNLPPSLRSISFDLESRTSSIPRHFADLIPRACGLISQSSSSSSSSSSLSSSSSPPSSSLPLMRTIRAIDQVWHVPHTISPRAHE